MTTPDVTLAVKATPAQKKAWTRAAQRQGRTLSSWVRWVLDQASDTRPRMSSPHLSDESIGLPPAGSGANIPED